MATTKRNRLKIIASIYDPIGIISPVVVLFKILFQKISLIKCEWESDLNPGLASKWKKLLNSLKEMTFTVPRFYFEPFLIYTHSRMLVNVLMPPLFIQWWIECISFIQNRSCPNPTSVNTTPLLIIGSFISWIHWNSFRIFTRIVDHL